ncbi:MAG: YesL family protein [Oscillospiraceae bacterium]|nr:YesL family protein [Oscillospiraceae bacterium]
MRKHFEETRIGRVLSALTDVILAGLMWFVCSVPIITIGASSTALYYVTVKSIRHERGRLVKTFFKAFRSNFFASFKIWLLYIVYALVFIANNVAVTMMGENASGLMSMFVKLMFIPAVMPLPWFFAYVSRFENTTKATISYVYYLCVKNLWRTLGLIFMLALTIAVCWLMPAIIPLLPGAVSLSMSYIIEPVFKKITEDMDDSNIDQWYNE